MFKGANWQMLALALAVSLFAGTGCQGGLAPLATRWAAPTLTLAPTWPASATFLPALSGPNQADIGSLEGTEVVLDLPQVTAPPDFAATGALHWPLPVTGELKQIYSPGHRGIDLAAPPGTPVLAADSGVVVFAGEADVYGNLVVLDHGNGYHTWYGHLSGFAVKVLDKVLQGGGIGFVGSTGASTGPHLHFEVRLNGRPVPPFSNLRGAPQEMLEANTAMERRTATAIAAATQTQAAYLAGLTATARYLAGQTATAAVILQQTQAAEQTRLAESRTVPASPTRSATPSVTPSPAPSLTPSVTPSLTPSLTPAPPSPTPSPSPSFTPTLTLSPGPVSATPTGGTPTPTQTPTATGDG